MEKTNNNQTIKARLNQTIIDSIIKDIKTSIENEKEKLQQKDELKLQNLVKLPKLNGKRFDLLVLSDRILGISIVVTYRIPDKYKVYTNIRGAEFTLSEYKKKKYKNLHMYNDSKEENVAFEMPFDESDKIKIFKKPYIMKAQTKFDMNYGDRYYWLSGELDYVEEGNKYGDTSEFVVIGFIEIQN